MRKHFVLGQFGHGAEVELRIVDWAADPGEDGARRVAVSFDEPLSEECLEQQVRCTQPLRAAVEASHG